MKNDSQINKRVTRDKHSPNIVVNREVVVVVVTVVDIDAKS
jgi:hypothetical protein